MGRRGPQVEKTVTVGIAHGIPDCPDFLTDDAKEIWAQLIPQLPGGLLVKADVVVLASCCTYWAQWRRYTAELSNHQPCTAEHRRVSQTANDSHTRLEKCVAELGLSPNSRARLRLDSPSDKKNELDEFLKGGK